MRAWVTFVVKDAAIFQGKYVGFTILELTEVVADFQTLQVLCEILMSVVWENSDED